MNSRDNQKALRDSYNCFYLANHVLSKEIFQVLVEFIAFLEENLKVH